MKCPTDGSTLVMSERSGIEIDYCPDCRGVWLDRGELDKIIDRVATESAPAAAPAPVAPPQPAYQEPSFRDRDHREPRDQYGRPYRKKKKEHWLSEIFD